MKLTFALLVSLCTAVSAGAQFSPVQPILSTNGGRLTVRPREAATATTTAQEGEHPLDSLPGYLVYVPHACVGAHRCPLYVFLDGGGRNSRVAINQQRPVADKYGMILLAPEATAGDGQWDVMQDFFARYQANTLHLAPSVPNSHDTLDTRPADVDTKKLDAALKTVLRTYAIDPNKIVLAGMSLGGAYTLFLGQANRDIFSRVVVLTPSVYYEEVGPHNGTTQFLVAAGLAEPGYVLPMQRTFVDHLRAQGTPVTHVLVLRPHENRAEDYDYVGRWLTESWRRSAPKPGNELPAALPMVALTDTGFAKWTKFWADFSPEPAARKAHQREFVIPVEGKRMAVMVLDMPALATQYPAIAADLVKAGLTAQAEQAYRLAVVSARAAIMTEDGAAKGSQNSAASVAGDPTSTANVAFLRAHGSAIDDAMWATP